MVLSSPQAQLFFKLFIPLLSFAYGQKLERRKKDFNKLSSAQIALFDNPELISKFCQANPDGFSRAELLVLQKWQNFVKGHFILIEQLKNGAILMCLDGKNPEFYQALGITDPIADLMAEGGPSIFSGVLIPWQDQIICTGLIFHHLVFIGPNYEQSFFDDYQNARKHNRVITSLPVFSSKSR